METTVAWVLLAVTAFSSEEFDFERIGVYNTMAECYFASTVEFWEVMPVNQEALCIRVEDYSDETNIP